MDSSRQPRSAQRPICRAAASSGSGSPGGATSTGGTRRSHTARALPASSTAAVISAQPRRPGPLPEQRHERGPLGERTVLTPIAAHRPSLRTITAAERHDSRPWVMT